MGSTSITAVVKSNQAISQSSRFAKAAARTAALLLAFVSISGVHAAGDSAAGEAKAYTCLGCHGVEHYVNTYPTYHVPLIAGQHAEYIVAALQAYRAQTRSHPTMQANAALLSDEDIQDIAAWFAAQGTSDEPAGDAAAGIELAATCAACHGGDGVSKDVNNPILAGQYTSYIEHALKSYRDGSRQNAIMSGFASQLSDTDIANLAAYFSPLSGPLQTAPRP